MSRRDTCPKCGSSRTPYTWKGNWLHRRCRDCRARWSLATLFDDGAECRAHPDRRYVWDRAGTCWREENYRRRFGKAKP